MATRGSREEWAAYMRDWYRRRSDEQRAAIVNRVSRYRKEHPDKVLNTRLNTHAKNPTKQSARRCVEAALSAGLFAKPDRCEDCGREVGMMKDGRKNIHAHHHDHLGAPLDVQWLCPRCHYRADQQLREAAQAAFSI